MQKVSISSIKPNMIVARNIYSATGKMLLGRGLRLTESYVRRLSDMRIPAVYVESPYLKGVDMPELLSEETRVKAVRQITGAFAGVRSNSILGGNAVAINRMGEEIVREIMSSKSTMVHMFDIRAYDDYTFGHCVNVCALAVMIGHALKWKYSQLMELAVGSLLHDIGKMMIPPEVLNKPGRFTPEERTIMNSHSELGFKMLQKERNVPLLSMHVTFQHHERFDGKGYPRGLGGKDIHEYARLTNIADVYDALTADRVYRKGTAPHEAYEYIMGGSGTMFDPDMVVKFCQHMAVYPVGTTVKLNTGDIGVVTHVQQGYSLRPTVRLIVDPEGIPYTDGRSVDLMVNLTTMVEKVLDDKEIVNLMDKFSK